MFEQMLLPAGHSHQGRCAVFALTGEAALVAIATLIVAYSPVAPLRLAESVVPLVLSPPPPPPPMARAAAPAAASHAPKSAVALARPFVAPAPGTIPPRAMMITDAAPALQIGDEGGVIGGVPGGVPGGVLGGSLNGLLGAAPAIVAPPKPAPVAVPAAPKRIKLGGDVVAASLTHYVPPAYPILAKQSRIGGKVRFTATIATDGTVKDVHLISGQPLLVESALNAVKQWVYRPTILNGQAVEVLTEIEVIFTLV